MILLVKCLCAAIVSLVIGWLIAVTHDRKIIKSVNKSDCKYNCDDDTCLSSGGNNRRVNCGNRKNRVEK